MPAWSWEKTIACPYNMSHQYHRALCEDRKLVEMTKSQLRVETNKSVPFTPATREAQDEEDDREVEATITTTYDPSKKASQMPVLWKLAGATPRARGRISGPWRR